MKKKHHGPATHSKHVPMHGGGNLSMPKPSHAIHVAPQKDKMAGNVGGGAHMAPDKKALGHQELIESGGRMKPKHVKEKY